MNPTIIPFGLPADTPVLTPRGPVVAGMLAPGAVVLAVSGVAAPFRPLVALERVSLATPLVRIRANALADGAPQDDLLLPPAQALLIDGALVAAGELVDGQGILAEPAMAAVDLVRLVLEAHDAVLAAGAAVETASPDPAEAPCAPRRAPDATLRALLAWRAEAMGWAAPAA
uniref:Hint domain-containing protein n=1 Tax=Roseomonas rosulenta TaxID=2748667 RepID=UPI0018DF9728